MTLTRAAAAALTALALTVLPGCGDEPPAPRSDTAAAIPAPPAGPSPVPDIAEPRDVTALIEHPCNALNPQQAVALGFPGTPHQDGSQVLGSQQCVWASAVDNGPVYTLRVIAISQPYLRPLEGPGMPALTIIGGFPAAVRPSALLAFCDIEAKTRDHQSITVSYGSVAPGASPRHSCEEGTKIAAVILANLPTGGGVR